MYHSGSTVELFDKKVRDNSVKILERLSINIANAEKLIDIQCNIASYFVGWWCSNTRFAVRDNELNSILFSAFHKNIISLYSTLRLTICGLYGPARPLMRTIFEWLMISKFSCIANDPSVIQKWHNEETIYFSNSVLKKIKDPSPDEFYTFWSVVCDYSHATRSSLQISLDVEDEENFREISINIAVLNALLECNYHLLNTHLITAEYEYMGKFYYSSRFSAARDYKLPELRKEAHSIFKNNRKFLGSGSAKLISAYKRKWRLSV